MLNSRNLTTLPLLTIQSVVRMISGGRGVMMMVAGLMAMVASTGAENFASGSAVLASDDQTLCEPAATFAASELLTDANAAGLDGVAYTNGYTQRIRTAPATWSSRSNVRWSARWNDRPRYLV